MQDKSQCFLKSEDSSLNVRRPVFCCIRTSTMCMLRCRMCFLWKTKYVKPLEEPTLTEWYNFIDLIGDLTDNSIEINVSGGEPLLDDRNLALISFSAQKGLSTSMPTNGFIIGKDMAYKIADSGLDVIGISLDGINRSTHDFLRGVEGCYDRVMQALSYLDRYCSDLEIGIQSIILEKNLDEIVRLTVRVNEDKRIKYIRFQAVGQPFNTPLDEEWYKKSEYGFLWPQDIKKVHAVIDELIKLKEKGCKISNSIPQLEVFKKYFEKPQDSIKKTTCNVDYWININQFGYVRMCEHMRVIGDIKRARPKEIWCSKEADKVREEIKNCRTGCHFWINCGFEGKN